MGGIVSKGSRSDVVVVVDFNKPVDIAQFCKLLDKWSDSCEELMIEFFAQLLPRTESTGSYLNAKIEAIKYKFKTSINIGSILLSLEKLAKLSPNSRTGIRIAQTVKKHADALSEQITNDRRAILKVQEEMDRKMELEFVKISSRDQRKLVCIWSDLLLNLLRALNSWIEFLNHLLNQVIGKLQDIKMEIDGDGAREEGGEVGASGTCSCDEKVKTEMMKRLAVEVGKFIMKMEKLIFVNRDLYVMEFSGSLLSV